MVQSERPLLLSNIFDLLNSKESVTTSNYIIMELFAEMALDTEDHKLLLW
jgi:hypothetical protein